MNRFLSALAITLLLLGMIGFGLQVSRVQAGGNSTILEFNTMVGVPRPYTGVTNAIRGVPGGGLPWVIASSNGELNTNGNIEVNVKGLVLDPTDPVVISRGLGGINPVAQFKVIVSCLSKDSAGNPTTVNVSSGLFAATREGDAQIEDHLALPKPCIAPVVFVASPGGAWFAATGF